MGKTMNRGITPIECEGINRRQLLQRAGALPAYSATAASTGTAPEGEGQSAALKPAETARNRDVEYGDKTLPVGVRSRSVDNNNGVTMHLLEAGFEVPGRRCAVLLHGFPELAYTWRHQLLPLAAAGFHVIAPDLRGYGRSATKPVAFDDDLLPYSLLNRVSDVLGLIRALGYKRVATVVGHDWGSLTAARCALVRPDVFESVVLMSTPFGGTDILPFDTVNRRKTPFRVADIEKDLATLPHPRKHYWWAYAARGANDDMWHAPQGVHDLLRALYYFKNADWKGNKPIALKSWTAAELAKMPTYYIMDLEKAIAETMAAEMPSRAQIAACHWMSELDLGVYSTEYVRTGFQGGLNSYRILTDPRYSELNSFSGRTIDVPALFIGGSSDWGPRQSPGALEAMQSSACTNLRGVHLVDGADHSIPEEQPERVNMLLLGFCRSVTTM
jgi:pimeloyl-ACP methyl ester carboxylesterase